MKKIFKNSMLLAFVMLAAVACKYDDGELWDKVNSLDERLNNVENKLTQINSDINSLSAVVNALQNHVYVKSVEDVENGYQITFTDGKAITITNGKDGKDGKDGADGKDGVNGADGKDGINGTNGTNGADGANGADGKDGKDGVDGKDGKDAPVISVAEFEGKYYWVQIVDETETWLTDADGNKLPVTGADAITPIMKVSADGYWMISYDRGITYEQVLDDANNPIKAVGTDGANGADGATGPAGANGADGDSFFSSVTVENNVLILTLVDGTELRVPLEEELPDYVALDENLGEDIDYAILGLDGSGYFYELQGENNNLPKRLSIYDSNNELVQFIVNFDDQGLPINILTEEFTIVFANHEGYTFDAVIITKEGESTMLEDVELEDMTWEEYQNYLTDENLSRAVSRSPIKWANAVVGGISCGLSVSATIAIPTPVGIALTAINCGSAIMSIADAAGLINTSDGYTIGSTAVGHYLNLASCAISPSQTAACIAGLASNVTAIADMIETLNNDDVALGEGALATGNGDVKITLTWDNYADIDLHCVDPSGYHIYYADKTSTTGGFLDYDNTHAYGPENIFFSPAPNGQYDVYLHYYSENNGISSVNYKVVIFKNGVGQTYEGTITGEGSRVPISTFSIGSATETRGLLPFRTIDFDKLPAK